MQYKFEPPNNQELYQQFIAEPTPKLFATIYSLMSNPDFYQWLKIARHGYSMYTDLGTHLHLFDAMQKLIEVDAVIAGMNPALIDKKRDAKILESLYEASRDLAKFPFQNSPHAFVFWNLAGTVFRHLCFLPDDAQDNRQLSDIMFKIAGFMGIQTQCSLMALNNDRAHACFLNSLRSNCDNPSVWFMLTRTMAFYQRQGGLFSPDDKDIFGDTINTWEEKIKFAEAKYSPPVETPLYRENNSTNEITIPIVAPQPPRNNKPPIVKHRVYCMLENQPSNFIHPRSSEEAMHTNFIHNVRVEENPYSQLMQPVEPRMIRQRNRFFQANSAAGSQVNITMNLNFPPPGQ